MKFGLELSSAGTLNSSSECSASGGTLRFATTRFTNGLITRDFCPVVLEGDSYGFWYNTWLVGVSPLF